MKRLCDIKASNIYDLRDNLIDSDHDTASLRYPIATLCNHPTLSRGLLGYWPLNDTVDDLTPNGFDGVKSLTGIATKNGRSHKCYSFYDGSVAGDVGVPVAYAPYFNTPDVTVSAWIRPHTVSGVHFIVTKSGSGTSDDAHWRLLQIGSSIRWQFNENGTWREITTSGGLTANQWIHVVGVYHRITGALMIYLDGAYNTQVTGYTNMINNDSAPVRIGDKSYNGQAGGSTDAFDGEIEQIAIWGRALDSREVYDLYNTRRPFYYDQAQVNSLISTTRLQDTTLNTGLVAFYPLDGNARDVFSNNLHGIQHRGTMKTQGGVLGGGYNTENAGNIMIPHDTTFNSSSMSFSLWVKLASIGVSNYQGILTKHSFSPDARSWSLLLAGTDASSILYFSISSGSYVSIPSSFLSTSEWLHVAGTYDGSTIKIYKNGELYQQAANAVGITFNTYPVRIGALCSNTGPHYAGSVSLQANCSISQVGLWNRALTDNEINLLWNNANGIEYEVAEPTYLTDGIVQHDTLSSGLVAYYPLDGDAVDLVGGWNGTFDAGGMVKNTPNNQVTEAFNAYLGSARYVTIANDARFNTPSITCSLWVCFSDYAGVDPARYTICKGYTSGDDVQWAMLRYPDTYSTPGPQFRYTDSSYGPSISFSLPELGKWHHWVMSFDDTTKVAKTYVDGVLVGSSVQTGKSLRTSTCPIILGQKQGSSSYSRDLKSQLGLWSRQLTDAEVKDLYNYGKGLAYTAVAPKVIGATIVSPKKIRVVFDNRMRQNTDLTNKDNYSFTNGLVVNRVELANASAVDIYLQDSVSNSTSYTVTVTNVKSEAGLALDASYDEATFPTSLSADTALITGLIGYYSLDGNANDLSGNGRHGTLQNSPLPVNGIVSPCYQFNGSSQYISMGTSNDFAPQTAISVGGWFYIDSSGNSIQCLAGRYYDAGSSWTNRSWCLDWYAPNLELGATVYKGPLSTDYATVSFKGLNVNTWHHCLFTYDMSIIRYYLDGREVNRTSKVLAGMNTNSTETSIGRYYTSNAYQYLKGMADEVGIWNRVLTPAEVLKLYNGGFGSAYTANTTPVVDIATHDSLTTGLLAYYDMEDSTVDLHGSYPGQDYYYTIPAPGRRSKAMFYNGTNWTSLGASTNLVPANITVSAWLRKDPTASATDRGIIGKRTAMMTFAWILAENSSGLQWLVNTPSGYTGQDFAWPNKSEWNHVVCTYDGSYMDVYLNGSLMYHTARAGGSISDVAGASVDIASNMGSYSRFIGSLDMVGIWSRAISQAEVTALYNNGMGLKYSSTRPRLTSATTGSSISTALIFNKKMSPNRNLLDPTNYSIEGAGVRSVDFIAPDKVVLGTTPLTVGSSYPVSVSKLLLDASGNPIDLDYDTATLTQAIPAVSTHPTLSQGLKCYLEFDGDVTDSTGNNTPTAVGSPGYVAGRYGQAIRFNGAGTQYVNVGQNACLDVDYLSAAAWVFIETDSSNWQIFFAKQNSAETQGWAHYWLAQSTWMFDPCVESVAGYSYFNLYTAQYQKGYWILVGLSYDGTYVKQWLNGKLVRQDTHGYRGVLQKRAVDLLVGQINGKTYPSKFRCDMFAMWNRALTETEWQDLYNGGRGMSYYQNNGKWNKVHIDDLGGYALPPARSSCGMAYDSSRQRMVTFGGWNGSTQINTTFEYNGASWCAISPTSVPAARSEHELVYDVDNSRVLMLFGWTTAPVQDIWAYNGTTWTNVTPSGTKPAARVNFGACYDSVRKKVLVFGGYDATYANRFGDTWELDCATMVWTQKHDGSNPGVDCPAPRGAVAMAYDSVRQKVVLFSGSKAGGVRDQEVWEWDCVAATWAKITPTGDMPAGRGGHAMVYDIARAKTICIGGYTTTYVKDVWTWNGTIWQELSSNTNPPPRAYMGAAYDTNRQKVVVFAGGSDIQENDTWELDV